MELENETEVLAYRRLCKIIDDNPRVWDYYCAKAFERIPRKEKGGPRLAYLRKVHAALCWHLKVLAKIETKFWNTNEGDR